MNLILVLVLGLSAPIGAQVKGLAALERVVEGVTAELIETRKSVERTKEFLCLIDNVLAYAQSSTGGHWQPLPTDPMLTEMIEAMLKTESSDCQGELSQIVKTFVDEFCATHGTYALVSSLIDIHQRAMWELGERQAHVTHLRVLQGQAMSNKANAAIDQAMDELQFIDLYDRFFLRGVNS